MVKDVKSIISFLKTLYIMATMIIIAVWGSTINSNTKIIKEKDTEIQELRILLLDCCNDNNIKDSVIVVLQDPLIRMKLIFNVPLDSNIELENKIAMGDLNMKQYYKSNKLK